MKLRQMDKAVLSVKNNAAKFLNGMTANVLEQPRNAFLDVHGKTIATFDQVKIGEDEFWIVVEKEYIEPLLSHLDRYARLSRAVVQKEDYRVYFDLDADAPLGQDDKTIVQKKGRLIIIRRNLEANVSENEFTLFRLKNSIPLQGADYHNELILNISEEDFVSFTKGCFLGQEPVSKVHSRSKPSWKLAVRSLDECDDEQKKKMTSKVLDPQTKKEIGFVFVSNR